MPRARSPKREEAIRQAHQLVEIDGLSRADATRRLWEAGYYEGARDYPSPGWITALLKAHRKRQKERRAELLRTKVTRGASASKPKTPAPQDEKQVSHDGGG